MKFDISPLSKFDYDLEAAIRKLSALEGVPKARSTVRSAMELLINDARGRVHNITGHLASGIQFRFSGKMDSTQIAEIGVSYKRTRAHHAHLVEYGHGAPGPHRRKGVSTRKVLSREYRLGSRGGSRGGRTPPHPFWAPAVEAQGQKVLDALQKSVNDILDDHNL